MKIKSVSLWFLICFVLSAFVFQSVTEAATGECFLGAGTLSCNTFKTGWGEDWTKNAQGGWNDSRFGHVVSCGPAIAVPYPSGNCTPIPPADHMGGDCPEGYTLIRYADMGLSESGSARHQLQAYQAGAQAWADQKCGSQGAMEVEETENSCSTYHEPTINGQKTGYYWRRGNDLGATCNMSDVTGYANNCQNTGRCYKCKAQTCETSIKTNPECKQFDGFDVTTGKCPKGYIQIDPDDAWKQKCGEGNCIACQPATELYYCDPVKKEVAATQVGNGVVNNCTRDLRLDGIIKSTQTCYETEEAAGEDPECDEGVGELLCCNINEKCVDKTGKTVKCTDGTFTKQKKDTSGKVPANCTEIKGGEAGMKAAQASLKTLKACEPCPDDVDCEEPAECPPGYNHSMKLTSAYKPSSDPCPTTVGVGYELDGNGLVAGKLGSYQYCFNCKYKNECDCDDMGYYSTPQAACGPNMDGSVKCPDPGYGTLRGSCYAIPVNVPCENGTTIACYEPQCGGGCETIVTARDRVMGYVVSDPDHNARKTPIADDIGGRCSTLGTSIADAHLGTLPSVPVTGAEFQVELTNYAGSFSHNNVTNPPTSPSTRLFNVVGRYTFPNLTWNTENHDVWLRIQNDKQTDPDTGVATDISAGQKAAWVCSCPAGYDDDPYTCMYKDVKYGTPSQDCFISKEEYNASKAPGGGNDTGWDNLVIGGSTWATCTAKPANFFVTVLDVTNGPWWQARGGIVYGDDGLESHIPSGTDVFDSVTTNFDYNRCAGDHCSPYLIAKGCNSVWDGTTNNSASYPLINAGDIDVSDTSLNTGAGASLPDSKTNRPADPNTSGQPVYYGPREDYEYFLSLLPGSMRHNVSGGELTNLGQLSVCNDNGACVVTGNLTISDTANIEVPEGAKYTVFISGNLNIGNDLPAGEYAQKYDNDNIATIKVKEGGYLSFIVQGDINIAPQIGYHNKNMPYLLAEKKLTQTSEFPYFGDNNPDSSPQVCDGGGYKEVGNIQGVFIANGTITVKSNDKKGDVEKVGERQICDSSKSRLPDKKFVGEGTFVGWGGDEESGMDGIILERSFDDNCSHTVAWHDRSPTETFNYRPDFLINAPEWMYRSIRLRQEAI